MPSRSNSRSTKPKTRPTIRPSRPCYRHPTEPVTGICPSCLRERLSGLDPTPEPSPKLRRSKSVVSVTNCDEASSSSNLRRKSCDVIVSGRNSLSNLFDDDDVDGSDGLGLLSVETSHLSRVTFTVVDDRDKSAISHNNNNHNNDIYNNNGINSFNDNKVVVDENSDEEFEEGEFRTMKEYIELECQTKSKKSKDFKEIAGSLASVFTRKLRKWKVNKSDVSDKSKNKKVDEKSVVGGNDSDIGRRRSCDVEQPRFSVDGGRISFEEPRASWDGYMIARTIPRLVPMFSVVENGILSCNNGERFENRRLSVDGPMHAIMEDDSSSGGSGNFHSDSSSSLRGGSSSFDQSSSVKSSVKSSGKKVEDRGLSPANVKLVITEKELKDWRLNSGKGESVEKFGHVSRNAAGVDVGNLNVPAKKSVVKWRKVCNVLGFKSKNSESKTEVCKGNVIDPLIDDISEKQGKEPDLDLKDLNGWKLTRSSSVVGSRNSCDAVGSSYRRRSVDNAGAWAFKREVLKSANSPAMELEDGLTPFYMTPLRSLRRSKSGKFKLQSTHSITGNVLQLN